MQKPGDGRKVKQGCIQIDILERAELESAVGFRKLGNGGASGFSGCAAIHGKAPKCDRPLSKSMLRVPGDGDDAPKCGRDGSKLLKMQETVEGVYQNRWSRCGLAISIAP